MIERFKRKPEPPRSDLIYAAKFDPAQPLDELRRVAARAHSGTGRPDLVVAQFPFGPVLIVRYRRRYGDGDSANEWEHVKAGDWLEYDERYSTLGDLTDAEIAHDYVRAD